jgi:hypothetical protein
MVVVGVGIQLCTGSLANTSTLSCVNASHVVLAEGEVTLSWKDADAAYHLGGAAPTSVRYAYSNYPQCALYNKYALPAGPFVNNLRTNANRKGASASTRTEPRVSVGPVTTPPMGINSWNAFHCNVDERKMRAMADALVSTGLAKAGYQYVNIGIQSPAPTQYIPPSSGNDFWVGR